MPTFYPNQACLWGAYSKERISVRVGREGGSPVTLGPVPPKILVPRSWYQDPGTKKKGELERRSLSKIERGGVGGCRAPTRRSGGLKAPQEQHGLGAAAPVKTILWHRRFTEKEVRRFRFEPPDLADLGITVTNKKRRA